MYAKITAGLLIALGACFAIVFSMVNGDGAVQTELPVLAEVVTPTVTPEPDPAVPKLTAQQGSIDRFDVATDPAVILPSEPTSAGIPSEIQLEVPAPSDLNDSGLLFNQTIDSLAPSLTKWLLPDEQVRKWVLTIDKLATGDIPKKYRPVEFSIETFKTSPDQTEVVISDTNYNRIKPFLDGVMSISPETVARYYLAWRPVLEEAYGELGKSGSFHAQLSKAIENVLAAPDAPTFAALQRPKALYEYKDRSYEEASDLEKLLWRLGPNNMHELQDYLKEIKLYL